MSKGRHQVWVDDEMKQIMNEWKKKSPVPLSDRECSKIMAKKLRGVNP